MQLEKIWYEASPFIYTVTGGYFLGMSESGILTVSSLVLISAGGTITAMRRRYALQQRSNGKPAARSRRRPSAAR